jgi:hypothetical protein
MAPVRAITDLVTVAPIPSSLCEFATACLLSFRRIPANWLHREIEGPHSSIVPNPTVEGLFRLHLIASARSYSCFAVNRCVEPLRPKERRFSGYAWDYNPYVSA